MTAMHTRGWKLLPFSGLLACYSGGCRPIKPGQVALPAMSAGSVQQQTRWPLLVDRLPELDTSRVVTLPEGSVRVFRTDISLTFKPNLSDSAKTVFLARHSMRVTGVTPAGRFFVRIPDPGPSFEALLQLINTLRAEPEVARAGWIPRDTPPGN